MAKIISIDAETDGFYGHAFAIGAVVMSDGYKVAQFQGRCPDNIVSNQWVKDNVLPALQEMDITHSTPEILEEAFWQFWLLYSDDYDPIAHCASPVETGLFRRCVERDLENRMFLGPFPVMHDVGTLLMLQGHPGDQVDAYNEKYLLNVPFEGSTHHPLYDAMAAAVAWEHACKKLQGNI